MSKTLFHKLVQYSRFNYYHTNKSFHPNNTELYNKLSLFTVSSNRHTSNRQILSPYTLVDNFHCRSRRPYLSSMDSPKQDIGSELRDRAHKICQEHLGGTWNKIKSDEMSLTPVSGGMSNLLYCCSLPSSIELPDGEPSQALLRLYGDQSRNTDMTSQVQIFELLSRKELGPKLYGIFDEGRLEEFLPAESLTSDELMDGDISAIIARKLAKVHSLDVPNVSKSDNWLLERFHEWSEFLSNQKKSPNDYASGLISESTPKIAHKLMAIDFEQEINYVRQLIDNIRSPIVFSHNDLHQGNILLAKPTKRRSILDQRVILIDFEYCSYNYRAYDIANHFCEWCFEYDTPEHPHFAMFENRFPSIEVQREFIRNYLDQQAKLSLENTGHGNKYGHDNCIKANHNGIVKNNGYHLDNNNEHENGNGAPYMNGNTSAVSPKNGLASTKVFPLVSEQEVDKILREIKPFCMAAHLVWTLWCIKSAYLSNIKFGYWEHAWSRWQLYLNMKRSYLGDIRYKGRLVNSVNRNIPPLMAQVVDIEAKR